MATIEPILVDLLLIFGVAAIARYVATERPRLPYTIVLVLAGISVAVLGVDFQLELTHDLILFVIIPTIFLVDFNSISRRFVSTLPGSGCSLSSGYLPRLSSWDWSTGISWAFR